MDHEKLYEVLKEIVLGLDEDDNGAIDIDEFRPAFFKLNPEGTENNLRKTFGSIDIDNSGFITLDELACHYGFCFNDEGNLESINTDKLLGDDHAVLELLHLEGIASEVALARANAESHARAEERREKREQEIKRRLAESRAQSRISLYQRSMLQRRKSSVTQMPQTGTNAKAMVQKHATCAEGEMLDSATIGDYEAVEAAVAAGTDVNVCDDKGETPLHKVCRIGGPRCVAVCVKLAEAGAEIDYQSKAGKTAAHFAAEYGHAEVLEWLLAKGADPDMRTIDGWTVLHEACFRNSMDCIERIFHGPNRPDINRQDTQGRAPIHIAAYRGDESVLELLVNHGADYNAEDAAHLHAADLAAKSGRRKSRDFLVSLSGTEELQWAGDSVAAAAGEKANGKRHIRRSSTGSVIGSGRRD